MTERTVEHLSVVPSGLRALPQWVCWSFVERNGTRTKVPFDARSGRNASSTDASTWSTFETALQAYQSDARYDGIGFVFCKDDPYCGIDLDCCLDPETLLLRPWAAELLQGFDTYQEISPSGTGIKIFAQASKPGPRCKTAYHDGAVEIYDRDRFFTVTGRIVTGVPEEIRPAQDAVERLYARLFTGSQSAGSGMRRSASTATGAGLTDDQIIDKAKHSRAGGKFGALWEGRWETEFGSQSEADASLVFTLAFYTKDPEQIDRLFRRSGLFRPKWDENHGAGTYGQITITKALQKVTACYQAGRPAHRDAAAPAKHEGVFGDADGLIALGQRDPATERLILCPRKTLPTARAFIAEFHSHPDGRTLYNHAGTLMQWQGNRFVASEDQGLRQVLQPWLHDALRYQPNRRSDEMQLVAFDSNPGTVNAALDSVKAEVFLAADVTPPCWLDGRKERPDPRHLLPFPSGTLDVETGRVLPPTPCLFNTSAIDFEYEPNPEPCERWIKFLEQLWGDDLESVRLLQEWMGYCLVADTSQQKMMLMVGPKRSGKGTIGRVLARLVGAGNVVGPTTSSLAGPFGLQPLIGKSLAIVSDARFGGEGVGVVVERLLCISGEDTLTVDRKFLGSVTMKLPTRFMFLTNELPRLNDASGALAGRFLILRLTQSFYGKEDPQLSCQLMEELPGILVWAIEGLKRLRRRGHFVQPQAVADAVQDMEDLASPVLAFVRECCVVQRGERTWVDKMYAAWKFWCESDGRTTVTSKQTFGRDLAAAVPGVTCRRNSIQGRFYDGISLVEGGAT